MPRKYNFIYKELVESEVDIVGHIAYSLYKRQKTQFIEQFKEESGKEPKESDFVQFNSISLTPSAIDGYKVRAELILQEFLNESLGETASSIREDVRINFEKHLSNVIEPIKPKSNWEQFFNNVFSGIVAAFFFSLILAAFVFIYQNDGSRNQKDELPTKSKLENKELEIDTEKIN